jgi:hypothetical protein
MGFEPTVRWVHLATDTRKSRNAGGSQLSHGLEGIVHQGNQHKDTEWAVEFLHFRIGFTRKN